MCGFAGFFGGSIWQEAGRPHGVLQAMVGDIRHRGPDHQGIWTSSADHLGFAHSRLAIVDVSPAGNQPMVSASGRYVIAYNGEIYNHLRLRSALAREAFTPSWRGHSDTETLLAGFEAWGVQETVQRASGMFAFSLWDKRERRLLLARDRLGEKPLYYGWQGTGNERVFLFGSELKPLARHPAFAGEIDRGALSLFMRHNYVPAPFSIYREISKLEPGTLLTLEEGVSRPKVRTYWSALDAARAGANSPLSLSSDEAVDRLEALLLEAVERQMMADVPLGAFLSGGIDSSTVVALMQARSARPVRTFTIGFNEAEYNEADHAAAVAAHLGTDHSELYITPDEARSVIPRLPTIYDEPFADSSQVPTWLVAALARRHVTVALSGDGGDELFGGYNRYLLTRRLWRTLEKLPRRLRASIAATLTSVSPRRWGQLTRMFPDSLLGLSAPGEKIHKAASVLCSRSSDELYYGLVSLWNDPAAVVIGGTEPPTMLKGAEPELSELSDVERMMALDMITYLPDDILCKVDRAAMSVSLETRVPLLDPAVVEFAWQLPLNLKLRGNHAKWALRQVLHRYVPPELIERPKMGFGVPIGEWLRGPLRDWAEDLLSTSRLVRDGFFHADPIRRTWAEHLSGSVNMQYHLWCVLMFQSWFEAQKGSNAATATAIPGAPEADLLPGSGALIN